ncbi:MAG: hypothetical protein EOO05_03510 [Chitinophagaceae bacterium]|nr:MAG: hypothetical protein EOO05_03510 [Chitinophagaceae bacterium]
MPLRFSLLFLSVLWMSASRSQQSPEGLDYYFKPTTSIPRYVAVTEKKDSGWYREIFFWPEKTLAKSLWFKDALCEVEHGPQSTFDMDGFLKTRGTVDNGKKTGPWLSFDHEGFMTDSINYRNGRRFGISMSFHSNGYNEDSTNMDENGNGVQVSWYDNGTPSQAGAWVQDTLKNKRWVYFYKNGNRKATEDYAMGKKISSACYDSTGTQLPGECEEREATFSENENAWGKFLQRNLNPNVPVDNRAPLGMYTIAVQFIVTKNGELKDFKALTKYGYGMEAEVIRLLKKSPKWIPALQFGQLVNAYRVQPVTFQVTSE